MSARRWLFPGAAPAVGLLLLFLSSFCGRADVVLVTGKPPAPGTVLEDDFSAHVDVAGLSPTDTKIVDRTEVRPDGSARMVRLVNTRTTGDIVVHRAFEGVPLVWRSAAQGWSATLESGGTPTEDQAADLKSLAPPFVTDSIYPARPVRLGERWNMSADAARDLLSRLEGLAVASEDVRDQVLSGWMELRLNNDALSPVHVFCHISLSSKKSQNH